MRRRHPGRRCGWRAGMGSLAALAALLLVMGQAGPGPFIHIDPIGDRTVGDTFTITATTSLPEGEVVLFRVSPSPPGPQQSQPGSSISGSVVVTRGGGNMNNLSFGVDTSSLAPGSYVVSADAVKQQVSQSAGFQLLAPAPASTPAPGTASQTIVPTPVIPAAYIRIDPIADRHAGDRFTITAVTSLSKGEMVLFQVSPSSTLLQKSRTGQEAGATGSAMVAGGEGGLNRLSFELDTASFPPGEYLVTAEAGKQDASHTVRFLLLESQPAAPFIRIDPVGVRYAGTRFTITAATNLAAGETVLFQVSPSSGLEQAAGTGGDTAAKGSAGVVKGDGNLNTVSFELDAASFLPGEYKVAATAADGAATDTGLFRLLQPATTEKPGPVSPAPLAIAAIAVIVIAVGALAAMLVMRRAAGRAAAVREPPGPAAPAVSIAVRGGIEAGARIPGGIGIRLDVETGIELGDGKPEE